jgi:alkylated DNA repair dioxygenase AlkB
MLPSNIYYQENVLTPELEEEVISWLDQHAWSTQLKRRTQQYGYAYNYNSRSVNNAEIEPISGPLQIIADWLQTNGVMNPQQCIVNEYTQTQGISAHTDSPNFGPVIVSISLLQPCNMKFTRGTESHTMTLMPRSILIMSGEARSEWKHQIPSRKTVTLADGSTYRKSEDYRRISLTYRTLIN